MVFLGIYRALYDYVPQGVGELAIKEGDLLFVLEKSSDDDWWRAKKKAPNEEEEEPEGLVPNNYLEEAKPISQARALYDYTRQTDEELSFSEEVTLQVYDTSDPDWTLVGLDGEYGFAPSNYIDMSDAPPRMPARQQPSEPEEDSEPVLTPSSGSSPAQTPAAAIAGIIQQKTGPTSPSTSRSLASPPPALTLPPRRPQYTPEESDEEAAPSLPQRPASGQLSPAPTQFASPRSPPSAGILPSPPYNRFAPRDVDDETALASPGGFRLYHIHEVVSHMGRNKKMPTTLGINLAKGIIMISPEKSRDGPQKEWTAEKLTTYSMEGKHVFMELVRPSKSVDFHAGAKDTAKEICSALGELAGAARAEGLREVLAAGAGSSGGQKKGQILYDFMAQGEDEVTVAVGDEVVVLDDTKSEEWWMVRRLKNGTEGVVPSSYVEVTGTTAVASPSTSGLNAGRSVVEQNRLEEERLSREQSRGQRRREGSDVRGAEVGLGLQLADRLSSLNGSDSNTRRPLQRYKRDTNADAKGASASKPKPDLAKLRMWTDHSGVFKVEAEFLGLKENKIHLHKSNGVKIAVPVSKMSIDDIEYVERVAGVSLDDEKPLSDIKRRATKRNKEKSTEAASAAPAPTSRRPTGPPVQQNGYDWFDFFLACGVNPQICERYASAFARDQMGEENLADIDPSLLRTLGLKEGDILRVMKYLDNKFGRTRPKEGQTVSSVNGTGASNGEANGVDVTNGPTGGLFSGPGGGLRNNTRKGRPAPAVQTTDVVDPKAFEQAMKKSPLEDAVAPSTSETTTEKKVNLGFDDDAWNPKPSKQTTTSFQATRPPSDKPAITGAVAELSLLAPLQPTPAPKPAQASVSQQQPQSTGANPSFFDQLAQTPDTVPQPTQRQRPQPPPHVQSAGPLVPLPPWRPMSTPLNQHLSAFGPPPLQQQGTGYEASIARPGQSLNEITQQRFQQQVAQPPLQMQPTPFAPGYTPSTNGLMLQPTGLQQFPQQQQPQQPSYGQFLQPQHTGFRPSFQQQFINSHHTGSPFADPHRQPFQPLAPQFTGVQTPFAPPQQLPPQQIGTNNILPPALQPQRTGTNGVGAPGFGTQPPPPPVPAIPIQHTIAPLQPQKTGPPPPVRFGVTPGTGANKLVPQPTGKRANLAQATPQNPFGF